MNNLKQTIYNTILRIANKRSLDIKVIRDQNALVDHLGLTSLDLARIIATLELQLDVDPFAERVAITSIRTAGDLCAAYATCFSEEQHSSAHNNPPDIEPTTDTPESNRRARQHALRQRARSLDT